MIASLRAVAPGMPLDVEGHQPGGSPLLVAYPALGAVDQGAPATENDPSLGKPGLQRRRLLHPGKYQPAMQSLANRVGPQHGVEITLRGPIDQPARRGPADR